MNVSYQASLVNRHIRRFYWLFISSAILPQVKLKIAPLNT